MHYLSISDLLLPPIFIFIILIFARNIVSKQIEEKPEYRYFIYGLMAKIIGGILVCLIYTVYYDGGDTTVYFYSGAIPMRNLFLKSPADFLYIMSHENTIEGYFLFDSETLWPQYWRDSQAFFVIRFISPLALFTFSSYLATSVLLSVVCYTGIWRLYLVFTDAFPKLKKELAISILFMPSVIFWGSGILKDSISLAAIGWFVYGFYFGMVKGEKIFWHIILVALASFVIISVKPYILYALIPGSLVWLTGNISNKIESKFFRRLTIPLMFAISIGSGYFILSSLGSQLGKFSINSLLERAVITQQDLKKDYYGGHSFDIGDFEATPTGILKKFPIAVSSGLFRPFLWEARNPMMLVSALENAYILYLTVMILLRIPFRRITQIIGSNQLLVFSLLFAVFFSFSVGLTTSNFGALVRYRIPSLPFFVSAILIVRSTNRNMLLPEAEYTEEESESTQAHLIPA